MNLKKVSALELFIMTTMLHDKDDLPVLRPTFIYTVVVAIKQKPRPAPAWTEKSYYFSFFSTEN